MRWLVAVFIAGCEFNPGQLAGIDAMPADVARDSSIDTPLEDNCYARWFDGTIRFNTPVELPMVNSSAYDRDPFLTPDELSVYVSSGRASGTVDLYVAKRATTTVAFDTPASDPAFDDAAAYESKLSITTDGLAAVVGSNRTGSQMIDVWLTTRATVNDNWRTFTNVLSVNTAGNEHDPMISGDGLSLYLAPQDFVVAQNLAVATRQTRVDSFGAPLPITEINSGLGDADPSVTPDERILLFATSRPQVGAMLGNVWYSTRPSKAVPFEAPVAVPDINTDASEGDPHLSTDGCRIYFGRDLGNDNWNIFLATAL